MKKYQPYMIPVSVKGIVPENGGVWLRHNERDEWELPGGKLEENEQPEETVVRELKEELGFEVEVEKIVQSRLYKIRLSSDEHRGVPVVTYLCKLLRKTRGFEIRGEAGLANFKLFSITEMKNLKMPEFYKKAIITALE